MFLYILRHAWAGHFGDPEWPDDYERPLSPAGRERFVRVVRQLLEAGCRPTIVATSPLVRCRQTADILAQGAGCQVEEVDALGPGADLRAALRWTCQQEADEVAWVGHAPDVGMLTAALVGSDAANIRFAKAACAAIRFAGPPGVGEGELYWHATAKLLGC